MVSASGHTRERWLALHRHAGRGPWRDVARCEHARMGKALSAATLPRRSNTVTSWPSPRAIPSRHADDRRDHGDTHQAPRESARSMVSEMSSTVSSAARGSTHQPNRQFAGSMAGARGATIQHVGHGGIARSRALTQRRLRRCSWRWWRDQGYVGLSKRRSVAAGRSCG